MAASASSAKIDSDPKKVEIEDSLHWTVDLVAAMDATQSSATVIALPRTGDGADYFSLVDNPGSYPGAQSSDFSGNVELTSASFELDDTTDNAVLSLHNCGFAGAWILTAWLRSGCQWLAQLPRSWQTRLP
ncbi:MAG: hypothetical protein V9G13_11085 [Marmoricola sp.]